MSKKKEEKKKGGEEKKKLETRIEFSINLHIFNFKIIKTTSSEKA